MPDQPLEGLLEPQVDDLPSLDPHPLRGNYQSEQFPPALLVERAIELGEPTDDFERGLEDVRLSRGVELGAGQAGSGVGELSVIFGALGEKLGAADATGRVRGQVDQIGPTLFEPLDFLLSTAGFLPVGQTVQVLPDFLTQAGTLGDGDRDRRQPLGDLRV